MSALDTVLTLGWLSTACLAAYLYFIPKETYFGAGYLEGSKHGAKEMLEFSRGELARLKADYEANVREMRKMLEEERGRRGA